MTIKRKISFQEYSEGIEKLAIMVDESGFKTEQILNNYNNSKIRGFIFTDVTRDGMMEGINTNKIKSCLKLSKKPLIVGGGLSNNNDLFNWVRIIFQWGMEL